MLRIIVLVILLTTLSILSTIFLSDKKIDEHKLLKNDDEQNDNCSGCGGGCNLFH